MNRSFNRFASDWFMTEGGVRQMAGNSYISIIFVELQPFIPITESQEVSVCQPHFTQAGINPDVQIFPPIKSAQSTLRHGVPLQAGVRTQTFITVPCKPALFLLARHARSKTH